MLVAVIGCCLFSFESQRCGGKSKLEFELIYERRNKANAKKKLLKQAQSSFSKKNAWLLIYSICTNRLSLTNSPTIFLRSREVVTIGSSKINVVLSIQRCTIKTTVVLSKSPLYYQNLRCTIKISVVLSKSPLYYQNYCCTIESYIIKCSRKVAFRKFQKKKGWK